MKKAIRIFSLILAAVLLSLTLASCGAPNSDPDKAKAALEKNGYSVTKTNGYVSGIISAFRGEDNVIDASLIASKTETDKDGNSRTESIMILYYKTEKAAKEAWSDIKDNNSNEDNADWVIARSGKMIYSGTKNAVKAAR